MYTNNKLQLYPLLRLAITFCIGIVAGKLLYDYITIGIWLTAGIVFIVSACIIKHEHIQSILIAATTLALGGTLMCRQLKATDIQLSNETSQYEALITSTPIVHGKVLKCDIEIMSLNGKSLDSPINAKATILRDTTTDMKLNTGDGICAESVLEKPHNISGNSNFDYAQWMKIHGYTAQTFIPYWNIHPARVSLGKNAYDRLCMKAHIFRDNLSKKIFADNRKDKEAYSVISAMTLGDKSALDKDTKNAFSISGGSHVLALSGLHLGIIFSVFLLLFGHSAIAMTLSIIGIWAFAFIVGMPPSVVRSAVMLSVYALVSIINRKSISFNTLAFAAIVILVINPLSLWDIGFQMSFMAVAGIFTLYKPMYMWLHPYNKLLSWIWGSICVSLSAQIFTFPIVLHCFGRFSCYFILTNFIVVPCATLIIYMAVALIITIPLTALNNIVCYVIVQIAGFMNRSIFFIAGLPCSSIENFYISTSQTWLLYIFILSNIAMLRRLKVRH
mgnify:FL=1